jgi:hypothetical protein
MGVLVDQRSTHSSFCKKCLECITGQTVRAQVTRSQVTSFMHYASTAWFYHFSRGNSTSLEMIKEMLRFVSSPSALVWIHIVASGGELRPLVVASKYLTEVVSRLQRLGMEESAAHRQALGVFSGWATDLVKIVGKFGYNLVQRPDSIYKLIPPFCPNGSVLYDQAGKKEPRPIQISGLSRSTWDDCLLLYRFRKVFTYLLSKRLGIKLSFLPLAEKRAIYLPSTLPHSSRMFT